MKNNRFYLLCGFALLTIFSCKDITQDLSNLEGSTSSVAQNQSVTLSNEWRNNPYKLNVIYFVPNDVDSIPNFRKRLSRILLDAQSMFANNMDREGFGRKSFGLDLVNDSLINIIYLAGNFGKATYPYEGGSGAVKSEVDAYYALNPSAKKSEHNLIVIPTYNTDPANPGGPPFYGTGTSCYALDYVNLDAKNLGIGGDIGWKATVWIGGMIHELGHGLNASHNHMNKTLEPTLGTALMGSGNSTYGLSTTSLTKTTAATFNNSQVFSTVTRSDWYSAASVEITSLSSSFSSNKIIVSGKFTTTKPVQDVVIWHDRTPYGGNQDYDAVQWATKVIGQDSFRFECPLADFYDLTSEYQLRIGFLHENGSRSTYSYLYNFVNSVPDLSKVVVHDLLPTTGWSIIGTDSQESAAPASNVLDKNRSTIWHTQWSAVQTPQPHYFSVNMGAIRAVKGLAFRNRDNLNGAMKDINIYSSTNGTTWTLVKTAQLIKVSGSWINVDLTSTLNTRYLKIESTTSWGDFFYSNLADFGVYSN
ncbi:discoidin domain-containing protein [Sphingobacterium sp. SRCM116780]|uniref:discoidin domain-containing protein n=1 Tax=Sphingobacterium sp. SRCM116780 TaxID=2907623 RepID=UPI001F357000|nr:discoidin domain-containing protein [Sphingobacterium sp. SRCM116780]UIR57134.1 discoidin domain-containing protein [Sphingobacterium sp. SRCM116780]